MNKKIDETMQLMEMAANKMTNAILDMADKKGEVVYEIVVDNTCGFTEYRTIEPDGTIYNENGCKCDKINNLTFDELYNICKYINKD